MKRYVLLTLSVFFLSLPVSASTTVQVGLQSITANPLTKQVRTQGIVSSKTGAGWVVRAQIPRVDRKFVRVGLPVNLNLFTPLPTPSLRGKIFKVSESQDNGPNFVVWIRGNGVSKGVEAGSVANIWFTGETRQKFWEIPIPALRSARDREGYVYVPDPAFKSVKKVKVSIKGIQGISIVIRPQEKIPKYVVAKGFTNLRDGSRITVTEIDNRPVKKRSSPQ